MSRVIHHVIAAVGVIPTNETVKARAPERFFAVTCFVASASTPLPPTTAATPGVSPGGSPAASAPGSVASSLDASGFPVVAAESSNVGKIAAVVGVGAGLVFGLYKLLKR